MICKKCGASVPDNTYECPFCGTQIGKVMPEPEEPAAPAEEALPAEEEAAAVEEADTVFDENERKRREQVRKMMDEKQQQLNEIQERREQKRKKAQRTKAAIIAAVCLGVGGAAYGITYYVSNYSGQPPQATEQPASATTDPNATPTAEPQETALPSAESLPTPEATTAPASASANSSSSTGSSSGRSGSSWSATGNAGSGSGSSSGSSSSGSSSSRSGSSSGGGSSSGSSSSGGGSSSGSSSSGSGSSSGSSSSGSGSSSGSSSSGSGSSSGSSSSGSGSSSGSSSSGSGASSSGVVRTGMNAVSAKGGEVIYDSNSGRYIMSFTSNGKEYYAYVSPGSSTDQIRGKNYTISATPTSNTFRGSTIFNITSMTSYDGSGYILKDSGTRLLTESDIAGMSKSQIALARNEIFARHGRPFSTPEYKDYFSKCPWYKVNPNYNINDDMSNLNETEQANVNFLLRHE